MRQFLNPRALLGSLLTLTLTATIGAPSGRSIQRSALVGTVVSVASPVSTPTSTTQEILLKSLKGSRTKRVLVCSAGCGKHPTLYRSELLSVGAKVMVRGTQRSSGLILAREIENAAKSSATDGTILKVFAPTTRATGIVYQTFTIREELANQLFRKKVVTTCLENCPVGRSTRLPIDKAAIVAGNDVSLVGRVLGFGKFNALQITTKTPLPTVSKLDYKVSLDTAVPTPGTVVFNNRAVTAGVSAPVFSDSALCGLKLEGSDYLAQLYYGVPGTQEASLIPVSDAPISFRTGAAAGFVNAGQSPERVLPTITAGANATIQIRVWTAASGASYEAALTSTVPGTKVGKSNIFTIPTGGAGSPPSTPTNLIGLQSFSIYDTSVWPITLSGYAGQCPTDLGADSITHPGNVRLQWTSESNPLVSKYRVYRDGALLTEISKECPKYAGYTDSSLAFNSSHNYEVAAVRVDGLELTRSAVTSVTLPDFCPITHLAATPGSCAAQNSDTVTLTWKRPVDGVTSYRIIRNGVLVGVVPQAFTYITDNSFVDRGVVPGPGYIYQVVAEYGGLVTESLYNGPLLRPVSYAYTGVGNSLPYPPSPWGLGVATAGVCPGPSFQPPTGLVLSQNPIMCQLNDYERSIANQVALSWTFPSDKNGLMGFHISRKDLSNGNIVQLDIPAREYPPAVEGGLSTGWYGDRTAEFLKSYEYTISANYSIPYPNSSTAIVATINTMAPCA